MLGPGENAGAVSRRRRAGVRVQGRVAQPPERGRALRGRRDRRRRHPARHLRDRRAADRDPRLAALRRGRRRPPARATCSSARSPASATTATRSASPPSAARSTSRARTSRTASSTRWRSGLIETDKLIRSRPPRASGTSSCCSGPRRAATGSAARPCWPRAELDDSEDKRPTVQIGDPFTEKKLLECSLELLDRGLLVALQDLGAAGLTSSSAEMAAKGEVGLDLDVRRVPLREADMEPFEIMVSESQERMLCVVEPEQLESVLAVCARWEVNGTAIGEVTDTRRLRVFDGDDAGRRHAGHGAGRRVPGLRPRARRARDAAVPGAAGACCPPTIRARSCSACSAPPTSPRASGRSSSTTRSSARAPCAGPSRPTPPCCCCRPATATR